MPGGGPAIISKTCLMPKLIEAAPQPTRQSPLPSVRTLLLWLLLASFLPGLIGVAALFLREYRDGRVQLQRTTLLTARAMAQALDGQLLAARLAAQALATSESLARRDFATFHRQASGLLRQENIGLNIVLSEEDGRQLVNTLRPFGAPLPRRAEFEQLHRVFASGQALVSNLFIGPLTGQPVVSVLVPVLADGKVAFALSVVLSPYHLSSVLSAQKLPPDWVGAIIDGAGTIVARTHAPQTFIGKKATPELLAHVRQAAEGIAEIDTLEGIPVLVAYSRSARSGWSVAIGIPQHSLEADLTRRIVWLGLGALLLFGSSLALAWFVGGRIAGSVRALRAPAIALGAGVPAAAPQVHLRETDEVDQAIAGAARLLQERASALAATNAALAAHEADMAQTQRIAQIGSWRSDAGTGTIEASPELCRIFGRTDFPPFARQDGVLFAHPAWCTLDAAIRATLRTGVGYNLELPALRGDGAIIWVNTRAEVVRDDGGTIVGMRGMVQDITERRRTESIARSERFIRAITDATPGMVGYWDKELCCRFANQAYLKWFGKPPEAILGRGIRDLLGDELFARNEPYIRAVLAGEEQSFERALTKADGSVGHTLANYIPDLDAYGEPIGFFVLVSDVTQLKTAEAELKLAANVYQNTSEAILVTDASGVILSVNPAFTRITGYTAPEAIGQTPRLLKSSRHEPGFYANLWRQIVTTGEWRGEIWNRNKNGEVFLESQAITRIAGASGVGGVEDRYISLFHDITDIWQKNQDLRRRAFHDALTSLPNRALLMERLEHHLVLAAREPRGLAVIFLDLDGFKSVNDTLGHAVGDDVLVAVAGKLTALVRQSDTVARLGGDEFVVMLDNPASADEAAHIAARIIAVVNEPTVLRGKSVRVGTSIGIAMHPAGGSSAAALIKGADSAMYQAKHAGKNTFRFHLPEVGADS